MKKLTVLAMALSMLAAVGCTCKKTVTDCEPNPEIQQKVVENKTKHLLYVALTRSLKDLTILITMEVEDKYRKENIINILSQIMIG